VVDFLKALDQIVDRALSEPVDLVIFAGDAYKDRNPQPTFQKEWGKRMMRLSEAGIPTLLLVGNHDVAPAVGRAHTVQEYKTLAVPNIYVADKIDLWGPDLLGLPLQILTVPWISRNALMTREQSAGKSIDEILAVIEGKVSAAIEHLISEADPSLPLILSAHASVQGARFGSERTVMLGQELVLSGSIVNDPRLDYVALGHIHKHQNLTQDRHPPVVYAGSIERIDFGEAGETKGFVLVDLSRGTTRWRFVKLKTRSFVDLKSTAVSAESFMDDIVSSLPRKIDVAGAVCRLQLTYPRDWEPLLDEVTITDYFSDALSFHIQKHRTSPKRSRLGDTVAVEALSPIELLDQYWQTVDMDESETIILREMAASILDDAP